MYCRPGRRAALAVVTLKELGFENVANLDGGFATWKDAGPATIEHHAEMQTGPGAWAEASLTARSPSTGGPRAIKVSRRRSR